MQPARPSPCADPHCGQAQGREKTLAKRFYGSRHEPFCTVLSKEMSDAIGVSRRQLPAKPAGLPS